MTVALHLLAPAVFIGAATAATATIAAMIAPQWRRIARLAAGRRQFTSCQGSDA